MKYSKLFLLPAAILLVGCSKDSFTQLKDNEVLVIGEGMRFRNTIIETESDSILSIPTGDVIYSLIRNSYQLSTDDEYYNGYYYSLNVSGSSIMEVNLGKKYVVTETSYSYMKYGKDDYAILLQTKVKTKTSYSYSSHWEYVDGEVQLNLNGYMSQTDFITFLPRLAAKVPSTNNGRVYVNAVVKETSTYSTREYDTYYYIEKV